MQNSKTNSANSAKQPQLRNVVVAVKRAGFVAARRHMRRFGMAKSDIQAINIGVSCGSVRIGTLLSAVLNQ
jgi:ribosomal protein L32